MVMRDKVTIDGIDVTDYRRIWLTSEQWATSIDSCTMELALSVSALLTVTSGMEIVITRGFTTSTDEAVFTGQITQVKPQTSVLKLVCKGKVYDAVKSSQVKSWDKDIDTEAGVGSEIFKSICDNSELSYSASSITSTGTNDTDKIVKFIQNDEDDFQKMNELADIYSYIISYDYDNEVIEFKPKGYTTYPVSLTVGIEIPGQIKWKENMEQMVNKVKIQGATVYDKIVETFSGPALEFELSKTPEDTEVRINYTTTDDLQTRGQKDVGTIGTDFDYYVDVETKKLFFNANVSDLWINYGAQVPLPITLKNQTSIDNYGGPNKKPHKKKFTFSDIKDINDAETRGRAILSKYSVPFIEATKIPVIDSIIETNGNIKPGYIVTINDSYNSKNVNVFVVEVIKSWPHVYDRISVGDETWKTEDWQSKQMEKINQLFNELNKNQDILIDVIDLDRSVTYERRYMEKQIQNAAGDVGIYGHPTFGIYGTAEYGSALSGGFVLGHTTFGILGTNSLGSGATSPVTVSITQGKNIYKEFLYDDDFYDSVTSTDTTWNTTTKEITILTDGICYTSAITLGTEYSYYTLSFGSITGTYTVEISGDGKVSWETVTESTRTAFTSSDTTGVYLRVTNNGTGLGFPTPFGTWGAADADVVIANTYTTGGDYVLPGIKIILE